MHLKKAKKLSILNRPLKKTNRAKVLVKHWQDKNDSIFFFFCRRIFSEDSIKRLSKKNSYVKLRIHGLSFFSKGARFLYSLETRLKLKNVQPVFLVNTTNF